LNHKESQTPWLGSCVTWNNHLKPSFKVTDGHTICGGSFQAGKSDDIFANIATSLKSQISFGDRNDLWVCRNKDELQKAKTSIHTCDSQQ
jgi:hypothetical protein